MKTKKASTKIVTGLALSLAFHAGLTAQNSTSHSANTNAIAGLESCAIGLNTLNSNTTGQFNTAIGRWALTYNTTGSENIAVGGSVLGYNNGSRNTAIGYAAMAQNTSGNENTASGYEALFNNTSGYSNTAHGFKSMFSTTYGIQNTASGYHSLYSNINGNNNVSIGHESMYYNTSGYENTAVGTQALIFNTSGLFNVAVGTRALVANTTGEGNTAAGYWGLYNNVANHCSTLGYWSMTNNNNAGAWGNTGVGAYANVPASTNYHNATAVGYNAYVNASDRIWLGDANVANGDVWSYGTYNTISDGRFKTNVSESDVKGLNFIKLLRPVVYNFEAKKATEFMTTGMPDSLRKHYLSEDFSKATAIRQSGFIAQEVAEAAKTSGYDFDGVHVPVDDHDTYGISYAQMVVPLVKAVQEMDQQKAALEQKVEKLERQLQELLNMNGSATGISQSSAIEGFALEQNIPNPFGSETVIHYTLPSQVKDASLLVYDLSGKQIASFPLNGQGASSITLSSEKLTAGIYIYSVMAGNNVLDSKRMIVTQKQ